MFRPNTRVVITGDSITDAGRARPVGEAEVDAGLGNGYPQLVNAMLWGNCPEDGVRIMSTGVSGDTSRDLLARFDRDVLALNPDYVTVMIGANDVWRRFDRPLISEAAVPIEEYEQNLRKMAELVKGAGAQLILLTPYFFVSNKNDPMRRCIDAFADVMRTVAKDNGLLLVDIQAEFDRHMAKNTNLLLTCWDRVHPNWAGHYVIADALLGALGYPFCARRK